MLSFDEALQQSQTAPHLLLGNGFSRACRNEIFAYSALFDRADFAALSPTARAAFDVLNTRDFEVVMQALRSAASLMQAYDPTNRSLIDQLLVDAAGLREVLVTAIADNHPELPSDIEASRYAACRQFLSGFKTVYTLNYDLLLYWALMNDEDGLEVECDDGFRTLDDPEGDGQEDYVTWEPGRPGQNIFYLHGALHIFDAGAEVQKYTWTRTGVRLIEQIRAALNNHLYPIFVAEGESKAKFTKIRHSDFLAKAYRSFQAIGGTLFIFGHSMATSDEHIIKLIEKGKVKQVFISIFGDPENPANRAIQRRMDVMKASRPAKRPLEVQYFSAETAKVWG